jgi:alkylation response protein AidB-like acyl-CoA dehydrogenase
MSRRCAAGRVIGRDQAGASLAAAERRAGITQIGEGTSQIQRVVMARQLLK